MEFPFRKQEALVRFYLLVLEPKQSPSLKQRQTKYRRRFKRPERKLFNLPTC